MKEVHKMSLSAFMLSTYSKAYVLFHTEFDILNFFMWLDEQLSWHPYIYTYNIIDNVCTMLCKYETEEQEKSITGLLVTNTPPEDTDMIYLYLTDL